MREVVVGGLTEAEVAVQVKVRSVQKLVIAPSPFLAMAQLSHACGVGAGAACNLQDPFVLRAIGSNQAQNNLSDHVAVFYALSWAFTKYTHDTRRRLITLSV